MGMNTFIECVSRKLFVFFRLVPGDAGAVHDRNRKLPGVSGAALHRRLLHKLQRFSATDDRVGVRRAGVW